MILNALMVNENLKQKARGRGKSEECDMYIYRQSLSEKNLSQLRNLFIFYAFDGEEPLLSDSSPMNQCQRRILL